MFSLMLVISCNKADKFEISDELGCVVIPPGDSIKIGVIQDLSGGASDFGIVQYRAILLALEKKSNRLLNHPIELIIEDESCTEEGGKNAAFRITSNQDVVGILGTTCSSAAVSASKIMSNAGLVMISGANSAPSLTSIGNKKGDNWYEGYFRTSANDSYRGKAAAIYAFQELGVKTAATIDDGDAYTSGVVDVFIDEFTKLGGQVVLRRRVDKGDENMEPLLKSILYSKAEFVYLPLFLAEGTKIINYISKMEGFKDVTFMGATTLLIDSFFSSLEGNVPELYFTGPIKPIGENLEEVMNEYFDKYNESSIISFNSPLSTFTSSYDAANILLDSIEKCAVRKEDGTIIIGRKKLRDTIYNLKDFSGISGILNSNKYGDCGVISYNILKLVKGQDMKYNVEAVFTYVPK